MGFGSYDETEQRDDSVEIDDENESVQRTDGELEFQTGDTDELLSQFKEMKDNSE